MVQRMERLPLERTTRVGMLLKRGDGCTVWSEAWYHFAVWSRRRVITARMTGCTRFEFRADGVQKGNEHTSKVVNAARTATLPMCRYLCQGRVRPACAVAAASLALEINATRSWLEHSSVRICTYSSRV